MSLYHYYLMHYVGLPGMTLQRIKNEQNEIRNEQNEIIKIRQFFDRESEASGPKSLKIVVLVVVVGVTL